MEYLILNQRLRLFAAWNCVLPITVAIISIQVVKCKIEMMMVEYQKIKSVKSDYAQCESSKDSDWCCDNDPLVVEKTKFKINHSNFRDHRPEGD